MKYKVVSGIMLTLLLTSMLALTFNHNPVRAEVPSVRGDVNFDGIIDIIDVVIWAIAFGSKPGDSNWNSVVDLKLDNVIDIFDGVIIGVNFGKTVPVPPIKIGVIGPMEWVQGKGMKEGAMLAAEEINDAGGVLGRDVVVLTEDDGGEDPDVAKAAAERLIIVEGVGFLIGGFRTECCFPIREVAMDYKKIFIITGSATTELINCWLTPAMECGECVRCDYDRYKYLFRIAPPNMSVVFTHVLVPFVKTHLIPKVMIPVFGKPIKVAVVVENAAWTEQIRILIDMGGNLFFGLTHPYKPTDFSAEIVYKNYPLPTDTDFSVQLQAIEDSGAHLIVHVFSAKAGQIFITQWGERKTPALPIGVDVLGQENDHWAITEGKCEYEVIASTPPRVNVTAKTVPFWDNYVARWGHDPIYTSFGAYDAVYTLAEAIERAGTIDSDDVVTELEKTDRTSTNGRFKFTNYHDVFVEPTKDPLGIGANYLKPNEPPHYYTVEELRAMPVEEIYYVTWLSSEYAVPLLVQWINGERVIVFPFDQPYTKEIVFPPWMLP